MIFQLYRAIFVDGPLGGIFISIVSNNIHSREKNEKDNYFFLPVKENMNYKITFIMESEKNENDNISENNIYDSNNVVEKDEDFNNFSFSFRKKWRKISEKKKMKMNELVNINFLNKNNSKNYYNTFIKLPSGRSFFSSFSKSFLSSLVLYFSSQNTSNFLLGSFFPIISQRLCSLWIFSLFKDCFIFFCNFY
jgi:hypothetical protein